MTLNQKVHREFQDVYRKFQEVHHELQVNSSAITTLNQEVHCKLRINSSAITTVNQKAYVNNSAILCELQVLNQEIHVNKSATTTLDQEVYILSEDTNTMITQLCDDINGFQDKVNLTYWEIDNNRLNQLENNFLNIKTTLKAVEDKV